MFGILPDDQERLIVCFLIAYPLAAVHRVLPSTSLRHLFSIVIGSVFSVWLFEWHSLHFIFTSVVVYVLLAVPINFSLLPYINT